MHGRVARSLASGEIGRAMVAATLLKLRDLDWDGAAPIAQADDFLVKFDPDQSRDWHGRWTTGGANTGSIREVGIQPAQEVVPWWGDALEIGCRLPAWIRSLPKAIREMPRAPIPKLSGKEKSDQIPYWAREKALIPTPEQIPQKRS